MAGCTNRHCAKLRQGTAARPLQWPGVATGSCLVRRQTSGPSAVSRRKTRTRRPRRPPMETSRPVRPRSTQHARTASFRIQGSPGTGTRRGADDPERPIASSLKLGPDHVDAIDQSHERCAALGVSRIERPDYNPLGRSDLAVVRDRNLRLHDQAAPVMEMLYEQIINTDSMVVLCDATGTIIHSIGDDDFLARASKVALQPGVNWSETDQGHQCHRHRADRGSAHARARRRALHARQPLSHLLGRAHPRPARQHPGRARRHRRPPQLPPAHHGAGEDVGAHDREPLADRRLPQRDAAALPQPGRVHRHADGRHPGGQRRRQAGGRQPRRAGAAGPAAARRCACTA